MKWRWTILVFALNFILSWLVIGVIWYFIAYVHGDILYFQNMYHADDMETYKNNSTHILCVTEIKSFVTAFLFSVETQTTIGKDSLTLLHLF